MNETMTLEERLEELCKDWESTYNNFSLEGMAYNTTIKRENEEIQKLVDNVFKPLTNNMIEVATRVSNFGDYDFNIIIHIKDDHTFSAHLSMPSRNLTAEQFKIASEKCCDVLRHNFVCTDTFKWDYENWCSIE